MIITNLHKFYTRELIANELEIFDRDDSKMLEVCSDSMNRPLNPLEKAIRRRHRSLKELKERTGKEYEHNNVGASVDSEEVPDDEILPTEMTKGIASREGPSIPRANGWRDVILQWDKGDPQTGLVPLHDWDVGMRRGCMGLHSTRKLMVKEFEHFGRDGNKMREVYGDHLNPVWRLAKAIRKRRRLKDDDRERRAIETPDDVQDEEERGTGEQGGQNGLNNFPVVLRISS